MVTSIFDNKNISMILFVMSVLIWLFNFYTWFKAYRRNKKEKEQHKLNDNLTRIANDFSKVQDFSIGKEREEIVLGNVRKIYEEIISGYFNLDLSNKENIFLWETQNLVFNFIKISSQPSSRINTEDLKVSSTIVVKLFISISDDNDDHIKLYDFINETKPYDLQKKTYSDEYLKMLIQKNILFMDSSRIVSDTFAFVLGDVDYVRQWIESEYDNYSKGLSKPLAENISYHEKRIYLDKNRFTDMIDDIGSEQFESELLECLYGFEQRKWYICASGLGGLLEHLMYLILENHSELQLLKSKIPTASNYISAFKQSNNIHFEQREERQINALFEIRNSISHFNGGYTAKGQCDYLLNGIRDIYINYYIPSKAKIS